MESSTSSSFKLPEVPSISTGNSTISSNLPPSKMVRRKNSNIKSKPKSNEDKATTLMNNNSNDVDNNQTSNEKLCPSCTKILLKTLKPIEDCIQNLYNLADDHVLLKQRNENHLAKAGRLASKNMQIISEHEIPICEEKNVIQLPNETTESKQLDIQNGYCLMELNDKRIAEQKQHIEINQANPIISLSNNSRQIHINQENDYQINETKLNVDNNKSFSANNFIQTDNNENLSINYNHHQTSNSDNYLPTYSNKNTEENIVKNLIEKDSNSFIIESSTCNYPENCTSLLENSLENFKINDNGNGNSHCDNKSDFNECKSLSIIQNFVQSNVRNGQEQNNNNNNIETESPFAYVTIIKNNLDAMNAIVLANSMEFYDNFKLNLMEKNEAKILKRYRIPMIALLIGNNVDYELYSIIRKYYNQIFELNSNEMILLNDDNLGIQHHKVHLWKVLANRYKKCIYLDPSTLIVGKISNLFLEYEELSASVDCFFPDYFNCSVFVFEPNEITYKQLIQHGVGYNSLNNGVSFGCDDPIGTDTLDEITLLNEYFASKWHKLSFIYNFVQNDSSYTQQSAYFKFGENIRIVNFGSSTNEPWHYKFDLNKATLSQDPFQNDPIDNFSKFYLLLFVRRLWPLLSKKMIPLMLNSRQSNGMGQRAWSVNDLMQIINRQQSGNSNNTNNSIGVGSFEQNTFTLRRMIPKMENIRFNNNQEQIMVSSSSLDNGEIQSKSMIDKTINARKSKPSSLSTTVVEAVSINGNENNLEDTKLIVVPSTHADVDNNNDEPITFTQKNASINKQQQQDWERGQIDWMHQYQSDKLIDRLKAKFH